MAIRSKRGTPITAQAKASELWKGEVKEIEESYEGFLLNQNAKEATDEEKARIMVEFNKILEKVKAVL